MTLSEHTRVHTHAYRRPSTTSFRIPNYCPMCSRTSTPAVSMTWISPSWSVLDCICTFEHLYLTHLVSHPKIQSPTHPPQSLSHSVTQSLCPSVTLQLTSLHATRTQDRNRVTRDYMLGWLVPDIVSSIPMDLIFLLYTAEFNTVSLKSTKGLKLLRLIRITKVSIATDIYHSFLVFLESARRIGFFILPIECRNTFLFRY